MDLNGIEKAIIHLSVPENYGFDAIISNYYSYHRDQNSYQLFRKPQFDTNVGLLLFLLVTPFQPSPITLLRVHLESVGNVTIHLNVPDDCEFHSNVYRLRLFLQNISCTYDLANGTAQNNVNGIHVFLLIKIIVIGLITIYFYFLSMITYQLNN